MEISLVRHQSQLVTLPWKYRDIRHFFLVGGYGCVPMGTAVCTVDGYVPVEDVHDTEVLSYDGRGIVPRRADSFSVGVKDCYEIATDVGLCVVSGFHEMLCVELHMVVKGRLPRISKGDLQYMNCERISKQRMRGSDIFLYRAEDDSFHRVLSVIYKGERECYDLNVSLTHNWIDAQGFVNHNCGKSFSDVMLIIELARRYPRLKPGAMFGVASLSGVLFTTTIGNTVEAICKENRIPYRLDKRDNIMHVGSAKFKIFNLEDYSSIAGYNFSVVLMDELDELPQDKALGAYKACRERARVTLPDGREPFLVTTTTAQGKRGIYKIIQNLKREVGMDGEATKTCVIHGRTIDNTNNDPSYYQDLYRAYDELERRAYLDGEFVALETGRVYPKYDADRNDIEPFEVSDFETVYIGQDLNLGYSSAVACVVRHDTIYIVEAYSFDDIWTAPTAFRQDFMANEIQWFPDSSSKDIFTLHGFKQEISKQDIRTRISTVNPSIIARTAMVNILLRQGRIKIFKKKSTMHLREGLDMRGFDKNGNPEKGQGKDAYDHMTDALEYAVFRIVQDKEEFRDIRTLRIAGNHQ